MENRTALLLLVAAILTSCTAPGPSIPGISTSSSPPGTDTRPETTIRESLFSIMEFATSALSLERVPLHDEGGGLLTTAPGRTNPIGDVLLTQFQFSRDLAVTADGIDTGNPGQLTIDASTPIGEGRFCSITFRLVYTQNSSFSVGNLDIEVAFRLLRQEFDKSIRISDVFASDPANPLLTKETGFAIYSPLVGGFARGAHTGRGELVRLKDAELAVLAQGVTGSVACIRNATGTINPQTPLRGISSEDSKDLASMGDECAAYCATALKMKAPNASCPACVLVVSVIADEAFNPLKWVVLRLDQEGSVVWRREFDWIENIEAGQQITDSTGNLFLTYYPFSGSLGLGVLRPSGEGFDDLGSLPASGISPRFLGGAAFDYNDDGYLDISALGQSSTLYWDGVNYS